MDITKFNQVIARCRALVAAGNIRLPEGLSISIETDEDFETLCIASKDDHATAAYELSPDNQSLWEIVSTTDNGSTTEGGVRLDGMDNDIADKALDMLLTRLPSAEGAAGNADRDYVNLWTPD